MFVCLQLKMPITLKHDWNQDSENIYLTVHLQGVQRKNVDVYTTPVYVKVNAQPYLFDVDLWGEVDEVCSHARFESDGLHFTLPKKELVIWPSLTTQTDLKERVYRRKSYMMLMEEKENQMAREKKKKKEEQSKRLFHKQWDMETNEQKLMDKRKEQEKQNVVETVNAWATKTQTLFPDGAQERSSISCNKERPAMRNSNAAIKVAFTKRKLPTPAREDRDESFEKKYEQAKQLKELQIKEKNSSAEAAKEAQQTGLWLKEKGDKLFQSGNVTSAINIYTTSLKRDPTLYAAYLNRALCFLSKENFHKCIEDCTTALQLLSLSPLAESKKEPIRLVALSRRGCALFCNGQPKQALEDYRSALEIEPEDAELQIDLKTIENSIEMPKRSQ